MMEPMGGSSLLRGLRETLSNQGVDFERYIEEFGQVKTSEKRLAGERFDLRQHVRALLDAQLSAQRSWGPIAQNEERLGDIFLNYDPDLLESADPAALERQIRGIRCGNRRIRKQMSALRDNIATLRKIERKFGTIDAFIETGHPDEIARQLSESGPFKLREIGFPLALEYLKNVGVRAGKPDLHVLRILGPERLAHLDKNLTEEKAYSKIKQLADDAMENPLYLDNLLWIFCAKGYGEICAAKPKCEVCELQENCRYPQRSREASIQPTAARL